MSPSTQTGEPSVSIIIPLFNEEEIIPLLIETIFKEFGQNPAFLELVLVDDGSRDRTASLVLDYASRESRIRLVQHDRNRGLGAAIRTGLKAAEGDLILYTDADLPFDFSLIPNLISLAGHNRVVSGYRLNRGEGARRWVLTKVYNWLIYTFFGLRVRDVNFACKVIPRRLARVIDLQSEGSFIDAEILLEAQRHGLTICQAPLVYYPRTIGQSTLSRPSVIFVIMREMAKYTLQTTSIREAKTPLLLRSPFIRYGLAFLATLCAFLLSMLLQSPLIGVSSLFIVGIVAVSLYGGWKPGVLATILSLVTIDFFVLPPKWSLTIGQDDLSRAAWFASAVLFAAVINAVRKVMTQETESWSEE